MRNNFIRFFFFKQKTAYEISACLVGSEMCIRDRYYITAAGRETLGFFRDKLTDAIEHDTIAYFEKNKMALRTVNSIIADYYKTPNQDYAVRCQFRVHDTNLIDLTLTVKNKEQAEAICNNWKKQNEDVYAYLMDILIQ